MKADGFLEKKKSLLRKIEVFKEQFQSIGYPDERAVDRVQFTELANNYNMVTEELALLDEKPRYDPIERLPEEIWLEVVAWALTTERLEYSFLSIDMALYLTLVSNKWRVSIESTPLLWTDIVYDEASEDLAAKIAVSLHLSRGSSLLITICGSILSWEEARWLLEPHRERIRGIHLVFSMNSLPVQKVFASTIEPLHSPHLRYIDWIQDASEPRPVTELFSHPMSSLLRNISPLIFSRKITTHPNTGSLRQISTLEDADRVLELSEHILPSLKKVAFLPSFRPKDRVSRNLPTKNFGWTSLVYEQGLVEMLQELLQRTPYLQELTISGLHRGLPRMLESMQELRSLRHLSIKMRILPDVEWGRKIITAPLKNLRKFTLRDTSDSNREPSTTMHNLLDGLFLLMPDLEVLEIDAHLTRLTYDLTSASGFRKMRELILYLKNLPHVSPLPERFELPSTVKELTIGKSDNEGIARGFSNSSIECLRTVVLDLRGSWNQQKDPIGWKTLQKLHVSHIRGEPSGWPSFSNVTTLILGGYSPGRESEDTTKVCAGMATSPEVLPAVTTLSFGRFPELDILFIMLERRNLAFQPGVARITKLSLPIGRLSPMLTPLRDLVQGRIGGRPSNFKVSMLGNVKTLLDLNVTGCIACHQSHTFCREPTMSFSYGPGQDPIPALLAQVMPAYPDNATDILRTWRQRSVTTVALHLRILACSKAEVVREITQDSLEESYPT